MADFKGTLGQWTLGGASNNQILDDKKAIIATAWCIKIGNQQQEANAKLIASAPELLEALKASKAVFEALGIYANHRIAGEQYDKVVEAIKKATE